MLSIIVSNEVPRKPKPFPKLMMSDLGRLVYFTATCVGFCIGNEDFKPEHHTCWNMGDFQDFHGTITITQE